VRAAAGSDKGDTAYIVAAMQQDACVIPGEARNSRAEEGDPGRTTSPATKRLFETLSKDRHALTTWVPFPCITS